MNIDTVIPTSESLDTVPYQGSSPGATEAIQHRLSRHDCFRHGCLSWATLQFCDNPAIEVCKTIAFADAAPVQPMLPMYDLHTLAGGIVGGLIGTGSARLLATRRGALNMVFAAVITATAVYMLVRSLSHMFMSAP
jgi:sugar phosphate permease